MAIRLGGELRASVKVGEEEVSFVLSRPSNEQLNKFLAARITTGKGGRLKDQSYQARCDLFDSLLVGIEGLEDENETAVTVEDKAIIPANWKTGVVFRLFEEDEISVKN